MLEQLLPEIFNIPKELNHHSRRLSLVDEMNELESKKLSCLECVGNCCTFSSNSMRISPIEAIELLIFLEKENRLNEDLVRKLEKNVTEFRLDKETLFGIKKNYTCPFYLGNCKGCSISRWSKPYGCLAFNATQKGVKQGSTCKSNQQILEKREDQFKAHEVAFNAYITKKLNLAWTLESIPVALLDIIKKGELCPPFQKK